VRLPASALPLLCLEHLRADELQESRTISCSVETRGMINAVGSMAGFAGPYAFGYLYNRTGSFSVGLGLMMVTALAAFSHERQAEEAI
jgi:nitrate/nitrite transporter NarK